MAELKQPSFEPPHSLPVLVTQMSLSENGTRDVLLVNEELPPVHLAAKLVIRPDTPPSIASIPESSPIDVGLNTPPPRPVAPLISIRQKFPLGKDECSAPINLARRDKDIFRSSSPEGSAMSEFSILRQIAKPRGEPGRPQSGGYNVESAMGWEKSEYDGFRKGVVTLVKALLDETKTLTEQDPSQIREALKMFPRLLAFEDEWPVIDVAKIHLQHSAAKHRKAEAIDALSKVIVTRRSKKRVQLPGIREGS
ncbi:hypothetical protein ACEPAF_8878 [Sanghuangporus sanghuang]